MHVIYEWAGLHHLLNWLRTAPGVRFSRMEILVKRGNNIKVITIVIYIHIMNYIDNTYSYWLQSRKNPLHQSKKLRFRTCSMRYANERYHFCLGFMTGCQSVGIHIHTNRHRVSIHFPHSHPHTHHIRILWKHHSVYMLFHLSPHSHAQYRVRHFK